MFDFFRVESAKFTLGVLDREEGIQCVAKKKQDS